MFREYVLEKIVESSLSGEIKAILLFSLTFFGVRYSFGKEQSLLFVGIV